MYPVKHGSTPFDAFSINAPISDCAVDRVMIAIRGASAARQADFINTARVSVKYRPDGLGGEMDVLADDVPLRAIQQYNALVDQSTVSDTVFLNFGRLNLLRASLHVEVDWKDDANGEAGTTVVVSTVARQDARVEGEHFTYAYTDGKPSTEQEVFQKVENLKGVFYCGPLADFTKASVTFGGHTDTVDAADAIAVADHFFKGQATESFALLPLDQVESYTNPSFRMFVQYGAGGADSGVLQVGSKPRRDAVAYSKEAAMHAARKVRREMPAEVREYFGALKGALPSNLARPTLVGQLLG